MKLTIFQERLPLPVEGYGGTERVSQAHFIGQCELNIHEVTLVCRSESTISHPNGNVIKLDEEILQDPFFHHFDLLSGIVPSSINI